MVKRDIAGMSELLSVAAAARHSKIEGGFDRLRRLQRDTRPHGCDRARVLSDIAVIVWETLRLRRFKAAVINEAIQEAVREFISELSTDEYGTPRPVKGTHSCAKLVLRPDVQKNKSRSCSSNTTMI